MRGPHWSSGYQLFKWQPEKDSQESPQHTSKYKVPNLLKQTCKNSLIFNQSDVFPVQAFLIQLTGGCCPATLIIPRERSLLNARRKCSWIRPVFMMEPPFHRLPFLSLHRFEHLFPGFILISMPPLSLAFPSVDLRVPFLGVFLLPTLPYLVPDLP